jgi:hypothetical protein
MRIPTAALLMLAWCASAYAEPWTLQLRFSVEGSSYSETLVFVSGLSYGLTYTAARLNAERKPNFYCLPRGQVPDSKLLIELLNRSLSGSQSAEAVTSTVLSKLAEAYPCR